MVTIQRWSLTMTKKWQNDLQQHHPIGCEGSGFEESDSPTPFLRLPPHGSWVFTPTKDLSPLVTIPSFPGPLTVTEEGNLTWSDHFRGSSRWTDRKREAGLKERRDGGDCLFAPPHRQESKWGDGEGLKRRGGGLWVDAASGWYGAVYWGDEAPPAQEEVGEFAWGQHR